MIPRNNDLNIFKGQKDLYFIQQLYKRKPGNFDPFQELENQILLKKLTPKHFGLDISLTSVNLKKFYLKK